MSRRISAERLAPRCRLDRPIHTMSHPYCITLLDPGLSGLTWDVDGDRTGVSEPLEGGGACLTISGWVFHQGGGPLALFFDDETLGVFIADAERPDVVITHPAAPLRCGFHQTIPAGQRLLLGAQIDGSVHWVVEVSFPARGMVLKGQDGYLFLDHDSNQGVNQYRGLLLMSDNCLRQWGAALNRNRDVMAKLGGQFCFVLAPTKEWVFPDRYPHARGELTTVDQFLSKFGGDADVLFPLDALRAERHLTYSKTDTHWTEWGASLAAVEVGKRMGLNWEWPARYEVTRAAGDLGKKLRPPVTESFWTLAPSMKTPKRIFFSGIDIRGEISVFRGKEGSRPGTVLIFGDSFSTSVVKYLAGLFERVIHVFSGADVDYRIVEHVRPDYLIVVLTTRFMTRAPFDHYQIEGDLKRKGLSAPKHQIARIKTKMAQYLPSEDPDVVFFAKLTLNGLGTDLPSAIPS